MTCLGGGRQTDEDADGEELDSMMRWGGGGRDSLASERKVALDRPGSLVWKKEKKNSASEESRARTS